MGMGLQAAFGNDAMAQALRQRIMDQIAAEQRAKDENQRQFDNDLRTKQFQSSEQLKNAQLQALIENRAAAEADRQNLGDLKVGEAIPAGAELPPTSPIVGRLQRIGQAQSNMTLPSTQMAGGITLPGGAPSSLVPSEQDAADAAPITGTLRAMQSPEALRSITKLPSATQQHQQDEADAKVEAARLAAENRTEDIRQRGLDRIAQIQAAAAAKPAVDKLVKVEHKDPATGRTVIDYLPQSQVTGKTFQKGTAAAVESRLASAEAVNQTGNDIIAKLSDPAYAAAVGPAMGRFSKLQDFIGNPPPEFSDLAGLIESYSLANMGVHGMRSAQGAQMIAKLLNQPHTPESIIAAIQGLNGFSKHFMENEGRGNEVPKPPTTPAPSSAPVRRYNPKTGKVE